MSLVFYYYSNSFFVLCTSCGLPKIKPSTAWYENNQELARFVIIQPRRVPQLSPIQVQHDHANDCQVGDPVTVGARVVRRY